jgi:hypothetical protein
MNALSIVKDTLATVRKNRALWFFGFFVAGAGAGGGAPHTHSAGSGGAMPSWVIPAVIVAALVGIAGLVMHVVSEAALIDGVRRARRGEETRVKTGMSTGLRYFWRMVGIKLANLGAILATTLCAAIPIIAVLVAGGPAWAGALGTAALAITLLPWLLTLYFIYEYAMRAAVVEDLGVRASLREGLRFLHGRLSTSLWLMVASGFGQAAAGVVGALLAIPVALIGLGVYFAAGLVPALVTGGVLMIPLVSCLVGALGAYRSGVWTHGYLEGRGLPA